jgi:general stress protein 26
MSDLKAKILATMDKPTLASFATLTENGKPWVRYVTPWADGDLVIRFATFPASRKVAQVKNNPEVHVTLGASDPSNPTPYIQVQGKAQVKDDEASRKAVWFDGLQNYFQGPDDPNMVVMEITPYRIEYMNVGVMEPEVWEA